MRHAIVFMASLILLTGFVKAAEPSSDSSTVTKVTLNKQQLGALGAAIRQMQKLRRRYEGQQVVISDEGKSFVITFMDDPVDIRVAGDPNATVWEIRKRDLKVVRELLAGNDHNERRHRQSRRSRLKAKISAAMLR